MNNSELYPLKFKPILKPTIWGGKKLESILNKPLGDKEFYGESWEISAVPESISEVAEGSMHGEKLTDLIARFREELLGEHVYNTFGNKFPLLLKFIDAKQDLSIQVHPNNDLAKKRHNTFGKTEMWYVVDADDGATLISGFNKTTDKDEYLRLFNTGRLTDLLNQEQAKKDDVFFLPAGRVHTIGHGLLIAEIQQTSNITYRIYDFDRVDKDGNKRELHVNEALDAIDFNSYNDYKTIYDHNSDQVNLVTCSYFVCNRLLLNRSTAKNYSSIDSFIIIMVVEGRGVIKTSNGAFPYKNGDTFLIPAIINTIDIVPENPSKLLEVYIPS